MNYLLNFRHAVVRPRFISHGSRSTRAACMAALVTGLWHPGAGLAQEAKPATASPTEVAVESVSTSPAVAAGFVVEAGVLYCLAGNARVAVELPGPARSLLVAGDRAFVALGPLGAAVVRVQSVDGQQTAVVEKLIPISHGEVTGFMVDGDNVWMQVSATSAIRLHGGAGMAPVTPAVGMPVVHSAATGVTGAPAGERDAVTEATPMPAPDGLTILKVFDGQVLLNRGKVAGLRVGDRFKVVRSEQFSDEGGSFDGEHEVAVVVVNSRSSYNARADIWRGDEVAMGDRIEPADSHTDPSLVYPRQLHGFVEAELHLRPLLNIGAAGFGVLMDDHLTYFAEHFYVGLRNEPFGLARTKGSTTFTQTTSAEGGYNSRPFALGLALGFTSVYGDLQEMFNITSSDEASAFSSTWEAGQPVYGSWSQDMQHAFALGQRVRLGAMDGLNLTVSNSLLYFPGGSNNADGSDSVAGFIWGGTDAKLTIPLAQRADLFIEGGGGVIGYAFGAVGVFGWISGNGGPGSLGLLASAGGAGVWGARTRQNLRDNYLESDDIVVAGPMVSLGLRYRADIGGD